METLESVLAAAADASREIRSTSLDERAGWLRAIADAIDAAAAELVPLAQEETGLAPGRLTGEVTRTTFQLRLIADAVLEGAWLEAVIDHPDPDWPTGARPDLRRVLQPLGPVLIVAAGNFPFAFSIAGGDTASALGAGCPVVVKAHPGHPKLSARTAALVREALDRLDAPAGTFAVIQGEDETQAALRDPRIKAGAFTGSVRGGRALFDIASTRPDPIPFYGELGSVNPAFVLPSAIEHRRSDVLAGFVGSFTLGNGQFCTKPGIAFLPRSSSLVDEVRGLVEAVEGAPMLNEHIAAGYHRRLEQMRGTWSLLVDGRTSPGQISPSLFATTATDVLADPDALYDEAFGPAAVLVEYTDVAELVELADHLPGQLTVTIHAEPNDDDAAGLLEALTGRAGRIVWNGWPTGVSVTWAMHHGGTWPATTASVHTSVGPTALRRFVTPVSFQDVPAELLPPALRDDNPWNIWRRVDGRLVEPARDDR